MRCHASEDVVRCGLIISYKKRINGKTLSTTKHETTTLTAFESCSQTNNKTWNIKNKIPR